MKTTVIYLSMNPAGVLSKSKIKFDNNIFFIA